MDFIKKFGLELFAEQEMHTIRDKIDYKTKGIYGLDSLLNKLNDSSYIKKQIQDSTFTTQSFLNLLLKANGVSTNGKGMGQLMRKK